MSRLSVSLFLFAACGAPQGTHGTGSSSSGPGGTPAAAAASSSSKEDEQICTEEIVTGSNIRRTVCRSQEQIDRERDGARQLHERSNLSPGPPIRD